MATSVPLRDASLTSRLGSGLPNQAQPSNKRRKLMYTKTFRVQGIPLGFGRAQVKELLNSIPEMEYSKIEIGSLAKEAGREIQTATATFESIPQDFGPDKNQWELTTVPRRTLASNDDSSDGNEHQVLITIDTHFRGITTLKSVEDASMHDIDCLAIPGLGGHAFGSFKQRDGSFMWLLDGLPADLPGARIMTCGFDTRLSGGQSFQDLESLGSTLRSCLNLKLKTELSDFGQPTPLILIAHSLGGLIAKQALIQMARDRRSQTLLKSIYGILLIGVPNQGLDITRDPQRLRDQCRDFSGAFNFRDSEVFCFYETVQSPTAIYNENTMTWEMKGPLATFLDARSAIHGRPWEDAPHNIQGMNRTHTDLVKFSYRDSDYDLILNTLIDFKSEARKNIRSKKKIVFRVWHMMVSIDAKEL
ncbi:MAG: hypothetical protein M1814_006346 [Vezdaea aestivalis]|nr:MAG: hypothetical protein M1814_006346 [Vezdaea aestivalis]